MLCVRVRRERQTDYDLLCDLEKCAVRLQQDASPCPFCRFCLCFFDISLLRVSTGLLRKRCRRNASARACALLLVLLVVVLLVMIRILIHYYDIIF